MKRDAEIIDPREAIRELTYRYSFYCDTKQWAAVAGLFAEDGVFDETVLGFPLLSGKEQLNAFFTGETVGTLDYGVHYVTNHFLTELGKANAKGICHLLFEGRLREGSRVKILGYIEDSYVRIDGNWLFRSRRLTTFDTPEGFDRVSALTGNAG
jgi:hypothetical protein